MSPNTSIDKLVESFFRLFSNTQSTKPNLSEIYELCISEALIIKNVSGQTEVYDLKTFIEPRERLLTNGELTDFSEQEIWEQTDIFGHIAQRLSVYKKSGVHHQIPFEARGMKTFQFILTTNGWKISAVAWDDESDQLKIDPSKYLI